MRRLVRTTSLGGFGGLSALLAVFAALGAPYGTTPAATRSNVPFCPGKPHELRGPGGRPEPKPGYAAHLIVGGTTVVAGQAPEVKLMNEGSDALRGQNGFVQRWKEHSWSKLPNPFSGDPVPPILVLEPPAFVTGCIGPRTGTRWPPGRYRWVQWYRAMGRGGPDGRHRLQAVFRVIEVEQ
jgi:hypothetical protein